ncbi:substrate-binding periplasmic protein [Dinoroseobacter sp. S375]|uniref:substrate-binding periplasmic protein n=1 Tax=Dinoroseobacter sp. S375 TaxID=3415136 RepID=UPI003C7B0326
MPARLALVCVTLLTASQWTAPATAAETVVLTTTEWPPYSGATIAGQGATSVILKEAFSRVGITLEVQVLPWRRAIEQARKGTDAIGYFPGYHCDHLPGFAASEPIGIGPLGFAENLENPITWSSVGELGEQGLRIGTVRGYANTEEFDQKVGQGWIRAVPAQTDTANLAALARGRVDAAVVDSRVLRYLLQTDPDLMPYRDTIRFDERPLDIKTLHACFLAGADGDATRRQLDAGLAEISADALLDDYLKAME